MRLESGVLPPVPKSHPGERPEAIKPAPSLGPPQAPNLANRPSLRYSMKIQDTTRHTNLATVCLAATLLLILQLSAWARPPLTASQLSLDGLKLGQSEKAVFQELGWKDESDIEPVPAKADCFGVTFSKGRLTEIQGNNLILGKLGKVYQGDEYQKVKRLLGDPTKTKLSRDEYVFLWDEKDVRLTIGFDPKDTRVKRLKISRLP